MLLIVSVVCLSQKFLLSIGGELALPGSSSILNMNAGTGFGGTFRIECAPFRHFSYEATVNYLTFSIAHPYSTAPETTTKVKAIPIQFGFKYYTNEIKEMPKHLFISLEAGIMPTITHFTYVANPDYNFKERGFSCAPGIGYLFGKIETDFGIQYNLAVSAFKAYYYNFSIAYIFFSGKRKK